MASSTRSSASIECPRGSACGRRAASLSRRAVPLIALATLGLALAGCGGGIDGAPTCDPKKADLTGQVGASNVSVSASFSGGLEQKSSGSLKGTFGDNAGSMDLTWPSVVADGDQTDVSGTISLASVQGGAVCVGDGSILDVESAGVTTFHLTNLSNCESGGSLPGDILGCVGF